MGIMSWPKFGKDKDKEDSEDKKKVDYSSKDWWKGFRGDYSTRWTSSRKTGRLGWEKSLGGGAFSSYLYRDLKQEELIKKAYRMAQDTITVMVPERRIKVKVSNEEDSGGSTSDKVFVSTKMFDDSTIDSGEQLDVFLGLTIHEGLHLLYTDMSVTPTNRLHHAMTNILEDERIERKCGEDIPGYVNFLGKTKYYYFDKLERSYKKSSRKKEPFVQIFETLLKFIRYPKDIDEEIVKEYSEYFEKIRTIIEDFPKSTKECEVAATKILEVLKDFMEDYLKKHPELSKTMTGKEVESLITKRKEGKPRSSELSRKLDLEIDQALDSYLITMESSEVGTTSATKKGKLDGEDISTALTRDDHILADIVEGNCEVGTEKETYFFTPKEKKSRYLTAADSIRQYVPAIRNILKCNNKDYKLNLKSMRSGLLDTDKLAEAYQGVPTVYLREGEVKTERVAVCVLIDESGSMSGKKIDTARNTAILINEAIGNLPNVDLFIYGHSGDEKRTPSTELYIYRELKQGRFSKYSLGSCKARCENRDGTAIYEIAKRVRKQTKENVLMFILSDGQPAARGYWGSSAIAHVKEMVNKTEALGFYVIQVCIDHCYDPSEMFKNYVIMDDMNTLAFELGKAIKKAILSNTKSTLKY